MRAPRKPDVDDSRKQRERLVDNIAKTMFWGKAWGGSRSGCVPASYLPDDFIIGGEGALGNPVMQVNQS